MHKRQFLFFLLFISSTVFAQQKLARQKILVTHLSSFYHHGEFRQRISTLPTFINDSTSDQQILTSFDSVSTISFIFPYAYALSDKDSSRYLAMVSNGFTRKVIIRYYSDGYFRSSARYNSQKQLMGPYIDYYEGGYNVKSYGKYKQGIKKGKWRYYDDKGKIIRKEVYRGGNLKREKKISHPHRTYLTLLTARNYVPVDYKIISENDTTTIHFAPDTIPMHHAPWALAPSLNYFQNDLGNLRTKPWMLNEPPDRSVMFGEELFIGSREKIYLSGGLFFGYSPAKTEPYGGYNAVHVYGFFTRYSSLVNVPVYKTKHTGFFVYGGTMWSTAFIYSQGPSTTSNGGNTTSTIFFQDSKIKSGTMISTGLVFDYSRNPNHPNGATYYSFRVGYNFNTKDPMWYTNNFLQASNNPKISFGGIYFSLTLNLWRARK